MLEPFALTPLTTNIAGMTRYLPAPFPLYESGAPGRVEHPTGRQRRWFAHWDGPIGSPAEEVLLGWSDGDATHVVCTSGRAYDKASARLRAAHLALGGTLLQPSDVKRASSAQETVAELERIRDAGDLWSPFAFDDLPGVSSGEATDYNGHALAYAILEHGAVLMAAVGATTDHLQVRTVEDWSPYGVDATREFALSDLPLH